MRETRNVGNKQWVACVKASWGWGHFSPVTGMWFVYLFAVLPNQYTQSIEWTVKHMAFISKSTLSRWLRGFFQWGYYIWLKKCWCYTSCLYLLYKVSSFNITGRCPSQVTEYVYSPLYLFFRIEKYFSSLHSLKMFHKSNCNRYWCWAFFLNPFECWNLISHPRGNVKPPCHYLQQCLCWPIEAVHVPTQSTCLHCNTLVLASNKDCPCQE